MTLRRLLPPLLCLLLLTGCAAPEENGPLSNTPPAAGEAADRVTLYAYDGETVTARRVADRETGEAVAAALAARNSIPARAVDVKAVQAELMKMGIRP